MARDPLKALSDPFRLWEIIRLLDKNLAQSLGAGRENPLQVPDHVVPDQALVRHVFDPLGHALERHVQEIRLGVPSQPASVLFSVSIARLRVPGAGGLHRESGFPSSE